MKNVYCIGEMLIDFVAEGNAGNLSRVSQFSKKAGGAPANVAAGIAKLGGQAFFVGAVGNDPFGTYLKNCLDDLRVNTSFLQFSESFTTLAFVSLDDQGERDFVFSRGADRELKFDPELERQLSNQIVHFGSATGFLGGSLEACYSRYLDMAAAGNALVSFDPNYRGDLWKNASDTFISKCHSFVRRAHLAKFSEEEALLISNCQNMSDAISFFHEMGLKLILVTMGKKGTLLSIPGEQVLIPSIEVKAVDTTGAGDAFVGCFLTQLAASHDAHAVLQQFDTLVSMVAIANRAGALTTTKFGAIPALPDIQEVGL